MASNPGLLYDWPWKSLGSFKDTLFLSTRYKGKRDISSFLVMPFLLWRMLHNQIWITISRYQTARGVSRIVDKGLEFDQVDRERNWLVYTSLTLEVNVDCLWDDQILLNGILYYLVIYAFPARVSQLPWWNSDGIVMTILLHAGPVEFLYYWLHRSLHHHYLYSRYHSHHHSSIVTEPITSVIHPFAEHIAYFLLFSIPLLTMLLTGTLSIAAAIGYVTYIDFMNNMGHCNFELIPKWLFNILPPLKYIMYTPSFHSLHHTQFRTNYSLFMPFYDYVYGTMDTSSDQLHQSTLKREEECPDVVHLTHLTTPESIYHLRLGFASLASEPQSSKWYLCLMWPVTLWSMMLTLVYGHTSIVESTRLKKLCLQTWMVPKYNIQYLMEWRKEAINRVIELDADRKGTKVLSLGLLNQEEELNTYGELYVKRNPKLKVKIVDGSCLAAAIVINSIPKGTTEVLLRGKLNKVAYAIALTLCQMGIQVATRHSDEYVRLKKSFKNTSESEMIISGNYYSKTTWLMGDGLTEEEQLKAPKGTLFIPYTQFPPKKHRKDCTYHYTPAMLSPKSLENLHSCEFCNWLPRRVMSAWRIAGIVHALEGWNEHECGHSMLNIDEVWQATLLHGFQPITEPIQ